MDGHGACPDPMNTNMQFSTSISAGHGLFPPLRASASDLTQSSVADASDSNSPPSTSSSIHFGTDSGVNSTLHSQTKMFPQLTGDRPSLSHLQTTALPRQLEKIDSGHDTISSTPFHSPPSARATVQLTPGQKRTASGGMKYSVSPDRPFSLMTTPRTGYHSRSMSTDSHSSRIAEISAQLRSRLSWAAAKVEKDRKSNPGGSKLSSPGKTSSPARGIRASTQSSGPLESHPAPKINGPVGERDLAAEVLRIATGFSNPRPDTTRNAPRSYHRHNLSMGSIPSNGSYQQPASNCLHQIPRLAPPADIVPGNGAHARRRPTQNSTSPKKFQIPSLSQQSSNSSTLGTRGSKPIPATPPPPQPSFKAPSSATTAILGKHCTPTQKTIMEQDAVETLVFMGSPENSGYYNDSRSQFHSANNSQDSSRFTPAPSSNENKSASTSSAAGLGVAFNFEPRRRDPPNTKRVSFADHGGEDQQNPYGTYNRPRLEQDAGDEIDRMLDEMGDSDNEQDYDWFAHMSGSRDNFSLPQQSSQWPNGQPNLPNSAIFQPRQ
ncbi:hypothetical protein FQN49_001938 [Arthroderma sp. PD_2]|nr:hypothetical protein FQN49_001938 [Arthroderma sp. PD_2]